MKQVMRFDVNGETDEVTRDELAEYQRVTKEHGDAPDEIQTFRLTGADGRSEDVDVPASEMEDFRAAAEQNGEKYQRVMTMQMDDGSRQDMTGNEVSRYLRSDAYRKSTDYKPPEQGSPTLAGAVGGVGGFFAGLWHGGNAAANAIAKAIPEIGIEVENAIGTVANGFGFAPNAVGNYLQQNAASAKAWLDEKIPSEAKEWTGYEDWSTKVSDKIGQVAAMAYKFAPAMATKPAEVVAMGTQAARAAGAKVVPDAASKFGPFMETVFGSDGVNAYADVFAKAKDNGASDIEAAEAGGTAFLINYFGGKLMMRAGGVAEGIESPIAKFMVGGAAVSDTMGVQAAANRAVENVATGQEITKGTWDAFQEGAVEGWVFHGMNAVPGAVLQGFENRAARIRYNEMARREILEQVKTADGAAQLAVLMDTEAIDRAIAARKEELARTEAGGTTSGREDVKSLAIAAGLPETMTKAEMIRVLDAVSQQRQAQAERVRTRMDDVQAEALAETIQKSVDADVSAGNLAADKEAQDVFEKTWLKAVEKVGDASVLDDPELRDKIVGEAYKAVRGEVAAAKEAERAEKSRIRGANVSDQMGEIEKRGIESWEDAEADGLIRKDERGRWSGGMRTALNIAINGTDKLKTAVKDGVVSGPVAEDLVTVSYCELGGRTPEERAALVDRILDLADGNEAMARRMMDKIGQRDAADETPLLDDLKRVADEVTVEMEREVAEGLDPTAGGAPERQPTTAFEGAVNAERMKGTELHSREGAVMGCERFPEVRVEISQEGIVVEGLTDELMSRPENAADAAALLKRLGDIAERNGLTVDLGDANAKTVADGIMDEINRGGLEATQRKMDTRAQLFGVLAKTTLGNGVTFDEASFKAALEKAGNGRQFVDNHGGVYGMLDADGVIHLNPTAINYNTPIHEYGHLALEATKKINNALWQRGMDLVKESSYYRDLLAEIEQDKDSPYAKFSDEQLRDEALARLIGNRGERLVETRGLEAKLKEWLKEFWKTFKGALGIADLTEEQIEKMSLGQFVSAINAELLRGKEFGSKKAVSLEKRSIKRFDEDQASGSNGMLRWKNDRGYLFAIPVDMERTQPGGRVVLATDDANVTDWIQNALNGIELRMSRTGKLYVKGRDGLDGELAEIFGRYPTIGQNDGIFEQIASETGREVGSTPDALVEALRKDRASYDAWAQGKDMEAQRLADEQAHAEWLAQQRWENSGMSVADYVRSRVEEGDPEFDLDWETAREIERDRAAGRFQVERQKAVSARINSVMDDLSTIETALEKDRTKKAQYYRQINERYGSEYEFDLGVPFGTISKFIPQKPIRLKLKTLLRKKKEEYKNRHPFSFADAKDIVEKINDPAFILKRQRSLEGVRAFYETTSGKVFCASILPNGEINEIDTLYPKDIERLVNVVKSFQSDSKMLLDCDKYKTLSILERQYNTTIIPENRKGLETAISILKSFGGVNGQPAFKEETLSQVDASTTQGHSASEAFPAHKVLQGQNPSDGSSDANTIPKSAGVGNGVAKMSVGNGRPIVNKSLFVAGRARVADPADWGEQTPGALAASSELSNQGVTPMSSYGAIRKMSLPLPLLEFLRKRMADSPLPAHVAGRMPGGKYASHSRNGQLYIYADVFGTVDKTDMAKEKAFLKTHGFFRNEDNNWCAGQLQNDIAREKRRSEDQLATQLLNLGSRRVRGQEPGGQEAARKVFADEVAKYILRMPQSAPGVLGKMQTIGKALRAEIVRQYGGAAKDAQDKAKQEAGGFLDWAYGGPLVDPATGNPVSRGDALGLNDLSDSMFGAWLVMPQEMERRAPNWSASFESTIAAEPKLADAFREMTMLGSTEQATGYIMDKLKAQQKRSTEEALKQLWWESREPISTGSKVADAKETLLVGFHDKFAPVYVRVDEKVKNYVKAEKDLLKKTVSAVDRAAIRQEIDRFKGEVGRKMHKLELSRTAYERGAWNEGRRYFMQMALLENKATEKWGLSEEDKSLYLQLQRVIETQGKAGSFGMTARNAQIGLDEMKTRLGAAKFAKLEQYSQEFFSIHEREILADARIERALGKSFVDYCRSQTHYVTTKRTFSPEELDAIETARAAVKQAGVAGGDDVITQMYAYAGARGAGSVIGEGAWLGKLKGSMAATQEVRSATWEKVDPLMQFGRRNQMVLDLRDALVEAGVEGVRDMVRTDGTEFPSDPRGRYGHINYMENGQKRVLVVPRQISDAFRIDPDNAQWITKANGLVRSMLIDYNIAYTLQNIKRNQDSAEKNVPGMHETVAKTITRGVAPGIAPITDIVCHAMVRNIPVTSHMFGKHTYFYWLPMAERYAKILENPTAWQQELWKAEAAGNVGKVQQMNEDFAGVMEMLRGNFLVPTSAAYAGAETHGFAFDMMNKKGLKTLAQIEEENRTRSRGRKFVDKINVFKKNQAQNEHEDILAKVASYLHDRANYAMQRSVAESGLMVKKNVSIAEGERSGRMKRGIQASMAQFFNMVEKGVVRHWKAVKERPGETLVKDGKVWIGRLVGMTFANGVIMKYMLDDDDVKGDEQKAIDKYGIVYRYAKAFHTAYQNCSDYVKENYNFTPIWNSADGMTSVIIGGALTDEDKLIVPSADLVSSWIAHRQGIGPKPEIGKAIANSTFKAVTPDLQLAAPIVNFLRATVEATMIDNPTDYFRNAPMYDEKLWRQRNESWEMRGKFAAQVGCRLWNDFGGRALLAADVNGVDNGRGSAPDTLEDVLRRIPVLSPAIARMIKIQVGSPAKKGEAITDRTQRTRDVINLLAQDLLKRGTPDVGWHESHLKEFQEKLADWKETYGLTDADLGEIQMDYYNGWIQRKNRSAYDQKALGQLFKEGMKQGLTEEQIWIQIGKR